MRSLNLNGFGNLPSFTHRQMVAELTGTRPILSFEFANSEMRITLFDMCHPFYIASLNPPKQRHVALKGCIQFVDM
jgi:hypothetical protein